MNPACDQVWTLSSCHPCELNAFNLRSCVQFQQWVPCEPNAFNLRSCVQFQHKNLHVIDNSLPQQVWHIFVHKAKRNGTAMAHTQTRSNKSGELHGHLWAVGQLLRKYMMFLRVLKPKKPQQQRPCCKPEIIDPLKTRCSNLKIIHLEKEARVTRVSKKYTGEPQLYQVGWRIHIYIYIHVTQVKTHTNTRTETRIRMSWIENPMLERKSPTWPKVNLDGFHHNDHHLLYLPQSGRREVFKILW